MLPHAEFWVERIHRTLLDSKDLVVSYMNVLENINSSTKQIIKRNSSRDKRGRSRFIFRKSKFNLREIVIRDTMEKNTYSVAFDFNRENTGN